MTVGFDPLNAEYLADPHKVYAELRDSEPLLWHEPMQSWVISRYEDCVRVLSDTDAFSADFRKVGERRSASLDSIQNVDPPRQQQIRDLLIRSLRSQDLGHLAQAARAVVDSQLSCLPKDRPLDFVRDLGVPVTVGVAMALFNQDVTAEAEFAENSTMIITSMYSGLDPSLKDPGDRARIAITEMLGRWYDQASVGYLASIRQVASESIERQLLLNSLRVVLMATINSVQRYLSRSLYTFLSCRGRIAEFQKLPSQDRALHELIRYDGPFQALSRACTIDTELVGGTIPAGTVVISLIAAANRDPRKFDQPEEVLLDRYPNPHLGFGQGNHVCFGAQLALALGRETFTALAEHHPDAYLAGEPTHEPNPTLRGLVDLPICLG
jgi:cytochrome P450